MAKQEKNKALNQSVLAREAEIKRGSKLISHLSATVLAVLFVMALAQFTLDGLNGVLVDGLFRTQWWSDPDPDIALIAYDDESSLRYDGLTKIPAEEIAQVFSFLAEEKPKAVGVLASINEKTYSQPELAILSQSFQQVPETYLGYIDDESLGKTPPIGLIAPGHYLPGYISRDTYSYGADSVTRRVMITVDGLPTLYAKLAGYEPDASGSGPDSHHAAEIRRHGPHYGRSGESLQTYVRWQGRAGTYPTTSSRAVAQHLVPRGTFAGKTVLFGSALQTRKLEDFILTPFSRERGQTTMLEGAANSLVTLIRRDGLSKTPAWFNWLAAMLIGILTVNMVSWLSPGRGILFVLSEMLLMVLASWVALFALHCWMELAHPLIVACVGYYLVVPYRLVDEYRKRWHYQEKSELMAQLEQLKSNFLSLISHDLKTPIARIQGNAELALNDAEDLSEKQRKCLNAIVQTTEDLSHYVETVLDLTRIESAKVPLQKTTKDINATILEVMQEKKLAASEKEIILDSDLEPLFSIKFDVKLIRQVLSNLVENAIKYSPDGSVITLSTREEGNWIRISVADQGYGIAPDEQEKIFSKFYRCENELTKQVKGTGLGLYLVKYFVELHQGMIELSSEVGKGSVFTVSLPV